MAEKIDLFSLEATTIDTRFMSCEFELRFINEDWRDEFGPKLWGFRVALQCFLNGYAGVFQGGYTPQLYLGFVGYI